MDNPFYPKDSFGSLLSLVNNDAPKPSNDYFGTLAALARPPATNALLPVESPLSLDALTALYVKPPTPKLPVSSVVNALTARARRGLGIRVCDVYTGKPRSPATLSGGETFIAALALALGLSDVVESASGKVRLDTIFIDEGFGSLDTENESGTLDQVLQTLTNLVSQRRAVGLISHVPLVQETVPNGFYVRKEARGSRIESRGAF
jgi:hypothetical protein